VGKILTILNNKSYHTASEV